MLELESLLERLMQGRIKFVVIGGFAAVAHGAWRLRVLYINLKNKKTMSSQTWRMKLRIGRLAFHVRSPSVIRIYGYLV